MWAGYDATDEAVKARWEVSRKEESLNLKGLLLVLPMNRAFYRYHGLDMTEYLLLDLYEQPRLHLGFRDRMHQDGYGFFQLARCIIDSEAYRRFIDAGREVTTIRILPGPG